MQSQTSAFIRAQFPVPGNTEFALLDNAGGSAPARNATGAFPCELSRAWQCISALERTMTSRILATLRRSSAVTIHGSGEADEHRLPVIAFSIDGIASASVPSFFDARCLALKLGHFYAHRLVAALGLESEDGVIRISLAHYNTHQDVDRLCDAPTDYLPN